MILYFGVLFLVGAVFGTLGDWTHVLTHTLGYPSPWFPLPSGQPFWVPPLFGLAVVSMGSNELIVQRWVPIQKESINSLSVGWGVFAFLGIYVLSGYLSLPTGSYRDAVLAVLAVLVWFIFDRTWMGAVLAVLTAITGVFVEALLVHLGAFYYYPEVSNFFKVPSWLPWLYVSASVAVGNLAKYLWIRWIRLVPDQSGTEAPGAGMSGRGPNPDPW